MSDTICVCIPTYQREKLLDKLLKTLVRLNTNHSFTYSIIVVDNSPDGSARQITGTYKNKSDITISYYHQPVKNISLTRNLAVERADCSYIAFIDDDEYADANWLLHLHSTLKQYDVHVVHGPVVSVYPKGIAQWIAMSRYFERKRYETGSTEYSVTGTGNCLIQSDIFTKHGYRFDPDYGLSGGEDSRLFFELKSNGFKFCFCNEAVAFERIAPERANLKWLVKRFFRAGNANMRVKMDNAGHGHRAYNLIRSLSQVAFCLVVLPVSVIVLAIKPTIPFRLFRKLVLSLGEVWALLGKTYEEYS